MCVIRLLSPDGEQLETFGLYHADPALRDAMQQTLGEPRPADDWLVGDVIATGRPRRIRSFEEWRAMRKADGERGHAYPSELFLQRLRPQSLVVVPLKVADQVIGTLTVTRHTSSEPYTDEDEYFLQSLADRAAQAIDNARLHREAREAEARYRTLIEHMPAVTYIRTIDEPAVITYISPQVEAVLGYTSEECLDADFWQSTIHPDDLRQMRMAEPAGAADDEPQQSEYRVFARDGRLVWLRDEAVLIRDEDGSPLYWQGVVLDITDRKELESELSHQAFHDALTGLPNRALFLDRAAQAHHRARRSDGAIAILFIDLDNFKIVNDSLGHALGDQLLVAVARRLQRSLRSGDTAARFGGDEFAILIEDAAPGTVTNIASRIVDAFKEPFSLHGREIFITPSIGIATGDREDSQPEGLVRDADAAMYRAKRLGKARYAVFDPTLTADAMQRFELESDLRRAIERNEFVLYYHPLFDLDTGEVTGIETLLRWKHPARGLLEPGEFISIAEETGLILPIGRWALNEACRQARAWQDRFGDHFPQAISVNLSARQFSDPRLVDQVADALATSGLPGEHLVLEITESAMVDDQQIAMEALRAVNALGVRIAVDDFGTGYSSLGVLRSFPVDALKIDRSFVDALRVDPGDTVIISAIIGLAQAMHLRIVAEGIETAEQLARLRDLGCDIGQGYFFGKPTTATAMENYFRAATDLVAAS